MRKKCHVIGFMIIGNLDIRISDYNRGRPSRDRMVGGLTIICAISVYHY